MPRDASETRARLLREAERLFAGRGVYQATVREITDAAGQRNVSALTYHFGSREGVLRAILQRHGDPLDEERGRLVSEPVEEMPTAGLVRALVQPLVGELETQDGRDYLRILAQLADRFPAWRLDDPLTGKELQRILSELESRAAGDGPAVQRERVVGAIMLMTSAMAERARQVDQRRRVKLDQATFAGNLVDMLVGLLEAAPGS